MSRETSRTAVVAAFLVGLGAAWNAGNVGPIVDPLRDEFGVSLTAVGLLSGTVFFAAIVVAAMLATPVAERIGVGPSSRWSRSRRSRC